MTPPFWLGIFFPGLFAEYPPAYVAAIIAVSRTLSSFPLLFFLFFPRSFFPWANGRFLVPFDSGENFPYAPFLSFPEASSGRLDSRTSFFPFSPARLFQRGKQTAPGMSAPIGGPFPSSKKPFFFSPFDD